MKCSACARTHSIEFAYDEVPEELNSLRYKEESNLKPGGIVRTFTALMALMLLALLPSALSAQQIHNTTDGPCSCTGYYDGTVRLVPVAGIADTPLVSGRISSGWGWRFHPLRHRRLFHFGIDIAAPLGSPIYVAADGVVKQARWNGGYGNWLYVLYGGGVAVSYSHFSKYAAGIAGGVHVRKGQVLGYIGSTGVSTGPHVHVEIVIHGRRVRPNCTCAPRLVPAPKHGRGRGVEVKS